MSLASASVASPIARSVPSLPSFDDWNNPLPEPFGKLGKRLIYLQTDFNRILEMHPNGTRGVSNPTEYCLLTITVVGLTMSGLRNWNASRGNDKWDTRTGYPSNNFPHLIMANKTGQYLCMDDNSIPYQRPYKNESTFDRHCHFYNERDTTNHLESYYRRVNETTKWYLGINRDGSIRCGNVTRGSQRAARFLKTTVKTELKYEPSKPYEPRRRPCCTKKKCPRRKCSPQTNDNKKDNENNKQEIDKPDKSRNSRRKDKCDCGKSKRWCKKKRRKFFKLSLKELKRYYNKCIKGKKEREKEREKRHCKCTKERRKKPCKDR